MLEPDPRSGEPRAVHFKGRWVDGQRHGEGLERVGVSETRVEYACAPSPDSQPTTRAGGAALSLSCSHGRGGSRPGPFRSRCAYPSLADACAHGARPPRRGAATECARRPRREGFCGSRRAPPPSCTDWTRLVLFPVLTGHVSTKAGRILWKQACPACQHRPSLTPLSRPSALPVSH